MAFSDKGSLQAYNMGVTDGKLQGTITWDGVEYVILGVPSDIKGLHKEPLKSTTTEKSK